MVGELSVRLGQPLEDLKCLPDGTCHGVFFLIETSAPTQTSEGAFEIIDQGTRRVGFDPTSPNARAKVGVMIDR